MENIAWHTEKRKVAELIPADYNPRIITDAERLDLQRSIEEYGAVVPVVVNADNTLIGGHQRCSIYADLGIEEVDVRVPSRQLNKEEEIRLNLRLNKNTGGWDESKLKMMDMDMLLDVGWRSDELSSMVDQIAVSEDEHDLEEEVKKAKTTKIKPGEIYQLGEHRMMCGDSTLHTDVEKVLGGERVDMIYCDPPYNIGLDYDKGVGNKKGQYGGEHSAKKDSLTTAAYGEFVGKTLENALIYSKKDVHVFYWCDEKYIGLFQEMMEAHDLNNKRVCLWIKNNASPTPGVAFNKVYEPCVYAVRGRPFLNKNFRAFTELQNQSIGGGTEAMEDVLAILNVWVQKRDTTQDYEHPTQKPVTLHEKALKRCSAPGSIVMDLFGGSGSTLMACEQLKRRAFLIEKDPVFAQVIINRWEKYTGEKAKLIRSV